MKTLIAANWKMHGNLGWAQKPAEFRKLFAQSNDNVEILLCPPAHMLEPMVNASKGLDIYIGAQNCHDQISGAYTGELSAVMVAETGAQYVILGHSERRAMFGDTDKWVAAKTSAVQKVGLKPIICVGERRTERAAGQAEEVVGAQLAGSIPPKADGENLVIAYEPVWAIGTGLTPTIEDIATIHDHIRSCLTKRFGVRIADKIQILYGGSVKPENAEEILALGDVAGAL
ncbi:MAG: triose-phosphate isomerase, partial [Robiginitomaculum sp.]|nr:triose-phosphate isomerase [Robiginitomaculum sp.]